MQIDPWFWREWGIISPKATTEWHLPYEYGDQEAIWIESLGSQVCLLCEAFYILEFRPIIMWTSKIRRPNSPPT